MKQHITPEQVITSILPDLVRAKFDREVYDYHNRIPSYWEQARIFLTAAIFAIPLVIAILGIFT